MPQTVSYSNSNPAVSMDPTLAIQKQKWKQTSMEAVWEFIVQKHMLVTVQWFHRLENGKCRKIGTESVYDAQRCDFIRSKQLSSSVCCCTVICCTPRETKFFSISHAIVCLYTLHVITGIHISRPFDASHIFLSFSHFPDSFTMWYAPFWIWWENLHQIEMFSSTETINRNGWFFRIFVRALFSILSKYPSVNEWIARFSELNLAKDFFLFWIFYELEKIFWCFALNWINKKK